MLFRPSNIQTVNKQRVSQGVASIIYKRFGFVSVRCCGNGGLPMRVGLRCCRQAACISQRLKRARYSYPVAARMRDEFAKSHKLRLPRGPLFVERRPRNRNGKRGMC